MIKKLRRRFIIVNMSILSCVLFGVLTGIFVYMYSSEVRISYELMESILNDRDIGINEPDKVIVKSVSVLPEIGEITENVMQMSMNGQKDSPYDNAFDEKDQNEQYHNDVNKDDREFNGDMSYYENPGMLDMPDEPFSPMPEPTFPLMPPEEPDDNSGSQVETPSPTEKVEKSTTPAVESTKPLQTVKPTEDKSSVPDAAQSNKFPVVTDKSEQAATADVETNIKTEIKTETKVTIAKTEKNTDIVTTVKFHEKAPELPPEKEPEPPFIDPYRGNVKRAYVMVQYNTENDIDRVFYQYFDDADEEAVKNAANAIISSNNDKGKLTIGEYKLRYMKKESPRLMSGGRIVFLDRTLEISTINRMLFIFIIIGSVGLILIFGISILLANWTVKPVDKAWRQQKQFVADASHELKTPLTVISANTDVILSNESDTVKNQSKWLNYIKDETARMTKLVNSMLYIAKYDSNELKFSAVQLNVSEIAENICLQYETLVFESGKTLETEIQDNVIIKGDEDKIKQLINILLDNARKYSTENGKIKLSVGRDTRTGKVNMIVSNTSEPIEKEKLEKLFDRFYRLDDSRNRKTGGSGLGLNIAKSIVEVHGGTIRAEHYNGITSFIVNI